MFQYKKKSLYKNFAEKCNIYVKICKKKLENKKAGGNMGKNIWI